MNEFEILKKIEKSGSKSASTIGQISAVSQCGRRNFAVVIDFTAATGNSIGNNRITE
ncbi:MAG: hypothetical protein VB021_08145 [Oscillospiraceae bacterium]|nr:hypothetical protein [Oscillospiraceae bacterium]